MYKHDVGPLAPEDLPSLQCPVCLGRHFTVSVGAAGEHPSLILTCVDSECVGYRVGFALLADNREELEQWPGVLLINHHTKGLADPHRP